MGFCSRTPTSNDLPDPKPKSPWLEPNDVEDELFLLISGKAQRCIACQRATRLKHLDQDFHCPDCRTENHP